MINTNELINSITSAMSELEAAQKMYAEMKTNLIPMTIDAANMRLKAAYNAVTPLVNAIQDICQSNENIKNLILPTEGSNRRKENIGCYVYFKIVEVQEKYIPIIPYHGSHIFQYTFNCIPDKEYDTIYYGCNHEKSISSIPYKRIKDILIKNFEAEFYEAVESYVHTVVKTLKDRAKSTIEIANKLTDTLKQIAGDDAAKEILCKNIHIGNGIDSVSMTDAGIVVNICGTEYLLNINQRN